MDKQKVIHELEIKYESDLKQIENDYLASELISKENALQSRNYYLMLVGAMLLVLAYLYYSKTKLNHGLKLAYNALMNRYNEEEKRKVLMASRAKLNIENQPATSEELGVMNLLTSYFIKEEPFLDSKLKISDVSEALKLSPKDISNAIKNANYNNFSQFVNEFRVNKVKAFFLDDAYGHLTVAAIGERAGFGSRQSFYSSFEENTGVKPGYFKAHLEKIVIK